MSIDELVSTVNTFDALKLSKSGGTMTGDIIFAPPITFNMPYSSPADYAPTSSTGTGAFGPSRAFDGNTTDSSCYSNTGVYDPINNYAYKGIAETSIDGKLTGGEWIQIQSTAARLRITSIDLRAPFNNPTPAPEDFILCVSDDNVEFTSILSITGATLGNNATVYSPLLSGMAIKNAYYFRIVITRTNGNDRTGLAQWFITFSSGSELDVAGSIISDVSTINGVSFDTLVSNIDANTTYRNVGHLPLTGGTITTDLTINGELNIGGPKKNVGATNGLQLYGPDANLGGPHIQIFTNLDNYPLFQQYNVRHDNIALAFACYYDNGWKSSDVDSNFVLYKISDALKIMYDYKKAQGSPLSLNVALQVNNDGTLSIFKNTSITGTLDMKLNNISNVGTLNGSSVASLITDVTSNTTYRNVGHLPLTGGTITADLTINGELNIGGPKKNVGAQNGLQLYGPNLSMAGPHIQVFTDVDNYPLFQQFNYLHDNIGLCFDCYYDSGWKSSDAGSNFWIYKVADSLRFRYDAGKTAGAIATPTDSFQINNDGTLSIFKNTSITGSLDMKLNNISNVGTLNGSSVVSLITNVSNNNAKVSYPAADSKKVGFISVTQPVDLDTMESNITTNNAKVSADGSISTHSDITLVNPQLNDILIYSSISQDWGNGSFSGLFDTAFDGKNTTDLSEGTNLYYTDARVSNNTDVKTNTAKVSASGSINTHNDVKITTPANGHVLTYNTGAWVNATPAAVDLSGYLPINGTISMTGNLNMGNQDIDNVNQVFIDRKGLSNNKLVLWDNNSGSTTAFYGLGIQGPLQSGALVYNIDGTAANHKFYYGGSNELFRIGHAGINAYRTLNVTGDITVSGNVQGYAKSTDVSTNYHAKANHIIPSANNVYDLGATPGRNYKLFRNLYLGGHASIYDYLMIGGAPSGDGLYAPYLGATKGLQIRAANGNIAGPHVQYMTDTDFYPLFQQLNWTHDNINLLFDAYYDGAWKSSDAGSNFRIAKNGDTLSITSNSGTAAGGAITWKNAMTMPVNGNVSFYNAVEAKMGTNSVSLSTPTGYPGVIAIDASRRFDQYM